MDQAKKILVGYVSVTGNTKAIAELLAEGVRIAGHQAKLASVTEITDAAELDGYDGFLLGSPTYHRDMVQGMKTFLFLAKKAGLNGKAGGAFGTYTHSGDAAKVIFDTMEYVLKMKTSDLGAFNVLEDDISKSETIKSCHHYAASVLEKL